VVHVEVVYIFGHIPEHCLRTLPSRDVRSRARLGRLRATAGLQLVLDWSKRLIPGGRGGYVV
jgi:hypothetical protein